MYVLCVINSGNIMSKSIMNSSKYFVWFYRLRDPPHLITFPDTLFKVHARWKTIRKC